MKEKSTNKGKNTKRVGNINYEDLPFKKYRDIGIVKNDDNYETTAGKRVSIAIAWIPKMLFFCKICFGICLFSVAVIFWSIYTTPSPTLLINYQDGRLLCSSNPIDVKTGKPYPREESKYEKLCANLNDFTTKVGE